MSVTLNKARIGSSLNIAWLWPVFVHFLGAWLLVDLIFVVLGQGMATKTCLFVHLSIPIDIYI